MRTSTTLIAGAAVSAVAAMLWRNRHRQEARHMTSEASRSRRADASDDSASYAAGAADEDSIPDTWPESVSH